MKNNIPSCPKCGEKMLEIVYGMPGPEIMGKVEKGIVFIGGCVVSDNDPIYHCNNCRRSYFENLKDYIEERNNFELEDDK